jgi:hypothetical protein
MSTATGPTLTCGYCRSTVDAADLGGDLARWQCTHCQSWNDRPHDPLELLKQEAREEGSDYDANIPAVADAARILQAALAQLVDRVQDVTRSAGYGAGMFEAEMAEARGALRKAQAAGIGK